MPEVKSASKEEFRLLLSATDYKDEEEEEVKDTKAKCKIPSERSKLIKIKKNIRQQKEKNYGTFKARAFQESSTAIKIDSEDKLFDSLIKEESFRPFRPTKADEAIKDVEGEVEITQRIPRRKKKRTYRRKKFIDPYVTTKAQEKAVAAIMKSRIELILMNALIVKRLSRNEESKLDLLATQIRKQLIARNCFEVAMKTLKVFINIDGIVKSKSFFDNRFKVNVINKKVVKIAKLLIITDRALIYITVFEDLYNFDK
ncbi:hypothetical protein MBM_05634 [Drepanopeziza brunnea f. sp. 'multigermtubi' MB_m1]|uniref:Uncharacterized protein n=1 Tax=Marssonina brunnea f. sp. multigermtubi (strain MB_m1) TaxID=1072389 RepID=K1WFS5_MARBU|nr:uncharacterized protein MBM_05634 [Drepanopeziza brunnea f. sp. 'multigermtubi' MB_m1]EKD16340.1 hypothetical protein MBM_05634 [Drepanopeziza brunnea f. sp. 'multigermtubi' MB_m1]